MLPRVRLGGLFGVMRRLQVMPVSGVRVMRPFLVIPGGVLLRGRPMVAGRMLMMFSCFSVMIGDFFRHG